MDRIEQACSNGGFSWQGGCRVRGTRVPWGFLRDGGHAGTGALSRCGAGRRIKSVLEQLGNVALDGVQLV